MNNELCNFDALPNIIRVIKSRRVRCVGHVAHMVGMRNVYKILSENLKGRDHVEDLSKNGNIISEWLSGK